MLTKENPDFQKQGTGGTDTDPPLDELFKTSLKVGIFSFGGPAAQISMMHQEFVERRKWLSEDRFLHALNYCMLLPGPEAQQLATYCGWIAGRSWGGLISGLLFILPGAVAMAFVSWIYARFGSVGVIDALFYGIKAGVLAVVLQALFKVAQKALKNALAWGISLASFVALFLFSIPFPIVIVLAAFAGMVFGKTGPPNPEGQNITPSPSVYRTLRALAIGLILWAAPAVFAAWALTPDHILIDIASFFATLAAVSFGGAYALLSYMAQVAVETKNWLTAGEMLDGLGLAETTPGPLILVTQFVGFLAGWRQPEPFSPLTGGLLAAFMTTWVTFVPSFMLVLAGAPWMEKLRGNQHLTAALTGITAAVTGTILNLAVWFALNVLFKDIREFSAGPATIVYPRIESADPGLVAIACVATALVFWARRGVATVVILTALLGLALRAVTTGL
ncbi:chromate efflux transporter [Roseibium sp. RKSG952]|uniref:chromate efflux transporter n=1 Tax=Roseibium sp. RKSG952 TaxID=2529384 RepID=UPI0012BB8E79|nr:chromate efflux transporter [Roseibium sp. RKSG952]MTH96477.1 chromate efflux transporter [Roseibium sp. RKSG952]